MKKAIILSTLVLLGTITISQIAPKPPIPPKPLFNKGIFLPEPPPLPPTPPSPPMPAIQKAPSMEVILPPPPPLPPAPPPPPTTDTQ